MKRLYLILVTLIGPIALGSCEELSELETHLEVQMGHDDDGDNSGWGDGGSGSIGINISIGGEKGPGEDETPLEFEELLPIEKAHASLSQGGDCWGDYFFQFGTNNTIVRIYDLALNTFVKRIYVPVNQKGFVSNCHSNTVNFGTEYFAPDDLFPLIYVSTGYSSDGYSGALAYRITKNTLGEFSVSLVQTLKFPNRKSSWTEFVPAGDYAYLCYTGEQVIYKFAMPKLADGDLILNPADALETFHFSAPPAFMGNSRNQDRLFWQGKIVFITGLSTGFSGLVFLNLEKREWERIINFKKNGLTSEPESIFVWQGDLCVAFKDRIVRLKL